MHSSIGIPDLASKQMQVYILWKLIKPDHGSMFPFSFSYTLVAWNVRISYRWRGIKNGLSNKIQTPKIYIIKTPIKLDLIAVRAQHC